MTRPRVVLPVALLAAGVAAVGAGRVWLSGRVQDAVLGQSAVTGTGAQVVPGLVALALVLAAAVLAAATSGPLVRRVCLVAGAAAALALALLCVRAVADAGALLGGLAAEVTGRTGTVPVSGVSARPWPWVVAALAFLAAVACFAGLAGAGAWRGLSQRYDAPQSGEIPGERGQRTPGAWDQLDRDIDPTSSP